MSRFLDLDEERVKKLVRLVRLVVALSAMERARELLLDLPDPVPSCGLRWLRRDLSIIRYAWHVMCPAGFMVGCQMSGFNEQYREGWAMKTEMSGEQEKWVIFVCFIRVSSESCRESKRVHQPVKRATQNPR